jgi:hypothetical protein
MDMVLAMIRAEQSGYRRERHRAVAGMVMTEIGLGAVAAPVASAASDVVEEWIEQWWRR